MRTRLMFAFAAAAALTVLPGALMPRGMNTADVGELAAAVGGGCYDCTATIGGCNWTSCNASGAFWLSKVGSGATQNSCFSVATGKAGTTSCTSNAPVPCFTYRTCTNAGCTNCGVPSSSYVNSNCQLTGYLCNG